jgi:hypothetical protein
LFGIVTKKDNEIIRVKTWRPEAVFTVGDDNYPDGSGSTIDENIGWYYGEFIGNYVGKYGRGVDRNRFYPALGNHDWVSDGARPYLRYFHLHGNERYYDVALGPVHVFILDSDPSEPDGIGADSLQARWLRQGLARAKEPWKIVLFHHPPYSSGKHGSSRWMQWPFREWGATAVISWRDHDYERLEIDGFPFFVNGLGGGHRRSIGKPIDGSVVRFASDHGAMKIDASEDWIVFQFITTKGQVIDTLTLPPG